MKWLLLTILLALLSCVSVEYWHNTLGDPCDDEEENGPDYGGTGCRPGRGVLVHVTVPVR